MEITMNAQPICTPPWKVPRHQKHEALFPPLFYPILQTIWKINCISLPSTQQFLDQDKEDELKDKKNNLTTLEVCSLER